MSSTTDLTWMARAKCRDMNHDEAMLAFFPDKGQNYREGKRICLGTPATKNTPGIPGCSVREECLAYALMFEPDGVVGVWGGTTPAERRRLLADPETAEPVVVGSYRNLERLGELVQLVSRTHRGR